MEQTEIQILDQDDAPKLLSAAKSTRLHVPVILALTTGMRRGEVLAIRWQDIDLDGAVLTVIQSLEQTKAGLRFKPPKSKKSRRRISLSPLTVDALRRHKVKQLEERLALGLGKNDSGLVFTTVEGEPVNPRKFSKDFYWIVKRSKIKRVTFHGLRHTHITQLLKDGEHIKVVSERVGHSSIAITLGVYGHVIPGMDEDTALRVDAAWGNALQE
ncbi:MAG: site-specific integrase [Rhodospirillales bacterium]